MVLIRGTSGATFFTVWTFSYVLIETFQVRFTGVGLRSNRTFWNRTSQPKSRGRRQLLFLLEQILKDEWTPNAAACMHQRATFVELPQLDGCEPELFGQLRHGSDRVLIVA